MFSGIKHCHNLMSLYGLWLKDMTDMREQQTLGSVVYPNTPAMSYSHLSGVGSQKCLRSDVTYTGDWSSATPPSPTWTSLSLHTNTHPCDFMSYTFNPALVLWAPTAEANKVTSQLFISSNNKAIAVLLIQVALWKASVLELHEHTGQPGNVHLIISELSSASYNGQQ